MGRQCFGTGGKFHDRFCYALYSNALLLVFFLLCIKHIHIPSQIPAIRNVPVWLVLRLLASNSQCQLIQCLHSSSYGFFSVACSRHNVHCAHKSIHGFWIMPHVAHKIFALCCCNHTSSRKDPAVHTYEFTPKIRDGTVRIKPVHAFRHQRILTGNSQK